MFAHLVGDITNQPIGILMTWTIPKGQKKGVWSGSKLEDFMDDNSIVYCTNGNYILFMANNMKSLEYSWCKPTNTYKHNWNAPASHVLQVICPLTLPQLDISPRWFGPIGPTLWTCFGNQHLRLSPWELGISAAAPWGNHILSNQSLDFICFSLHDKNMLHI